MKTIQYILLIVLLIFLSGCGIGSGGDTSTQTINNTETLTWDNANWDETNWQ